MDVLKYISVLMVVFLGGGDTGGHGESHHDHVKLHVPEFIHHDHHTKVITIHHHHHKPKEKHHHHHHHHHHKPIVPYGHHYHKQHKKSHTKTQTSSSGHGQGLNSHRGHHGHHGKYGHHGHHTHTQKHHDTPIISYDPNPVTFGDDYKPFSPSVPATIPQTPQVYGVQHTVKQVKVFDSIPGVLPSNVGSHGYEVTEEGEQSDEDAFTAINNLPQTYPATFGFVRNAGIDPAQNDVLADFPVQSSPHASLNPFSSAPQPTSYANIEAFSAGQAEPFSSLAPTQDNFPSIQSSQFPLNVEATGYDDPNTQYSGDITGTALVSPGDTFNEDTPVSFSREAGIQETVNTGGIETIEY